MTKRPLANLTRETLAPIWARHDVPTERMAEALGVTRQALSWKAISLGLPRRSQNRRKNCSDAAFLHAWNAGLRTRDMAVHFGYAHTAAVRRRAEMMGLKMRRRGWSGQITIDQYLEMQLAEAMQAVTQEAA